MHKLLSHLLFKRLQPTLDDNHSADQAGFRMGYSTTDHLFTLQELRKRATEWHQPLWVAAIDITKTFDTVEHSSVWAALREQSIEEPYTQLLTKIYDQERASMHTDAKSKHFHCERGNKEGDLLSTRFFNSLLQHIMNHYQDSGRAVTTESDLPNTTPTSPTSDLQTTFFSSAAH